MTALARIFRTTAFKLSLGYLAIFGLGAALVFGTLGANVKRLLDDQIAGTVEAEIKGLAEQYAQGGVVRLVEAVNRRTAQPGASLYLVTTFAGETLAGNVATLPGGVLDVPADVETSYRRAGEPAANHRALARIFLLPGGFRLLVGRDLEERDRLRGVLGRAFVISLGSLAVIGTLGGLFVARRVLRRVDAMTASAQDIMSGDLSRRVPVAGTRDELDRLAQNLNAMLDRIGELMEGLRQVSDNIAHDLRTPLTRLRNGAEQALRLGPGVADHRAALEKTIEEADGLIRLFNALLMIARTQAGGGRDGMAACDLGEVTRGVAELYEPVAEDRGIGFHVAIDGALPALANRELIGQAVSNLIDNALNHGEAAAGAAGEISVGARRVAGFAEISVADRGKGIAPQDRARALERFVRLEEARSRPGSGLGLALASAVARLHGGTIRLEDNAPGLRVVMSVALPSEKLPAPQSVPALPARAAAAPGVA